MCSKLLSSSSPSLFSNTFPNNSSEEFSVKEESTTWPTTWQTDAEILKPHAEKYFLVKKNSQNYVYQSLSKVRQVG